MDLSCEIWRTACPGRLGVVSPTESRCVWRRGSAPCPRSARAKATSQMPWSRKLLNPVHGDQLAVIHERADSDDAASAASTQSMGKMDRQAPGWTKRVRVGKHPPHRTPCPGWISALEQTILGYADKLGDLTSMKAGLQTQRSVKRCMKLVMARLVKESEGTIALRANDVHENHLGIQRAVHGDEHM